MDFCIGKYSHYCLAHGEQGVNYSMENSVSVSVIWHNFSKLRHHTDFRGREKVAYLNSMQVYGIEQRLEYKPETMSIIQEV